MAWSSAGIIAAFKTRGDAGNPLIVARNSLDRTSVTVKWTDAGQNGSTDVTASDYPTTALNDRRTNAITKRNGATSSDFYINVGLASTALPAFDIIAFINHNWHGLQVDIQIDNDPTFAGATTIATITPGSLGSTSGVRFASIVLADSGSDPLIFSGVEYLRVKVTNSASITPYLGELWIGNRYVLPRKFDRPYTPHRNFDNSIATFEATGGSSENYVRFAGRGHIQGSVLLKDIGGLDYSSSANPVTNPSFFDATIYSQWFSKSVLWWESIADNHQNAFMLLRPVESWLSPRVGPNHEVFDFDFVEEGPYFLAQDYVGNIAV